MFNKTNTLACDLSGKPARLKLCVIANVWPCLSVFDTAKPLTV